jgi:hypothetical protein
MIAERAHPRYTARAIRWSSPRPSVVGGASVRDSAGAFVGWITVEVLDQQGFCCLVSVVSLCVTVVRSP